MRGNWRGSLHFLEVRHLPIFLRILAATLGFQNLARPESVNNGSPLFPLGFLFICFLDFYWLGRPRSLIKPWLTQLLERCHSQFDPLALESEFSLTVGDEDELEEDVEE